MNKKTAFTLVELLVVISIIALLLAILMPSLVKSREQAKKIVCGYNIKMINTANQIYVTENSGWCVPFTVMTPEYAAKYGWHGRLWFQNDLFRKYMTYDSRQAGQAVDSTFKLGLDKKFACPADMRTDSEYYKSSQEWIRLSFGMNYSGLTQNWSFPVPGFYAFRANQIPQPALKVAFMDALDFGLHELNADYKNVWDKYHNLYGLLSGHWNSPAFRHGTYLKDEGANAAFFDGHNEYSPKNQFCKYGKLNRVDQAATHKIWRPGSLLD